MVSTDAYEFMQGLLADVPGLDVAATMKHIKRRFGGMDEQRVADAVEQVAQMDGLTTDNIMDRIRDKVIPIPDSVREFAKRAFPDWAATPPLRRSRILNRFRGLLEQNADLLAAVISTEHGKPEIASIQ